MHLEDCREPGKTNKVISVNAVRAKQVPLPGIIIGAIFIAGFMVMLLLELSPLPIWIENPVDPFLLVVFLFPLLELFVFNPRLNTYLN